MLLALHLTDSGKIPGLSKRTSEVLSFIAKEGPMNIYQIRKKLKQPSYSTVHKAVKTLESLGLLKVQCVRQTEKGVYAKVYGLTFFGLIFALIYHKMWLELPKIVAVWEEIAPTPLRKYSHFVKLGLKENSIRTYRNASLNTLRELMQLNEMIRELAGSPKRTDETFTKNMENIEQQAKDIWNNYFLESVLELQPPDTQIKWYNAFRSDPELRKWMIDALKNKSLHYHTRTQIIEEVLGIIEQPQEPSWEEIKKKGIRWSTEVVWKLKS